MEGSVSERSHKRERAAHVREQMKLTDVGITKTEHHVQLSNLCCLLCRDRVCVSENSFAVLGFGLDYRGHTLCFKFPDHGYPIRYITVSYGGEKKKWRLCRHGRCPTCRRSPLAFVVHAECMSLFQNRRPKIPLSHMWHLGLWLNPIPGAHYYVPECSMPRFSIEEETTYPETKELRSCLKAVNTLPEEIFTEILAKSETPLISRFSFVLAWHPESLDRLEPAADAIRPQELNGWSRRDFRAIHRSRMQFEQNVPPEDPRYFIIGLDTLGIRAFQLLEDRPTVPDSKFPDCLWYIVDKLSRLDDYYIRTNGYFLRLDPVRTLIDTLMLWDTPAPPDQFTIVNDGLSKPMRMRCIVTEQCTGISVFCNGRKIYGIYAHKGNRSSAADIYKRLCHYRKDPLMWIYFPLAPNEGICGVWIRQRFGPRKFITDVALMIKTTLDRCYIFGPCFNPQTDDSAEICLSKGQVSHLIHEDPDDGDPILCFGQTLPNDVQLHSPEILQHPPTFHNKWDLFHSRASLENVEQVCLFFDERRSDLNNLDKCCLGMLFTYSNGHKGALGQCRMGLSLTATIEHPTSLHFAEVTFTDGKTGVIVRVSSGNVGNNLSHKRQWQSTRMTGIITWWFNSETIIPCIEEEEEDI